MQIEFKVFHLKVPQIQFILRVRELPVVQQRRVPTVQTVQKTQRFHGPGAVRGRRRCDHAATSAAVLVLRTVEVPQTSSSTKFYGGWRRVPDVFLLCFYCVFSDSVHLDVESQLSGSFSGAPYGQQLLVVAGPGVPGSPGVLLPGDLTPLVCMLIHPSRCRHRHVLERPRPTQPPQKQQSSLGRLRVNRRGTSTPLGRVESRSLPSKEPNPSPAIPPCVGRTPHLHGAPTTEETVKL